jgi:choline dehydrogenase-like flavoprotein
MIRTFTADDPVPPHEVCVIGSGPVGLAVALECAKKGLRVVVLESGALTPAPRADQTATTRIADPSRHADLSVASARALGGTSHWWGGRCVPLDPIDLSERPWMAAPGWPIAFQDFATWQTEAAAFLGCDGPFERKANGPWAELDGIRFDRLERWAPQINIAQRHRASLRSDERITVLLGATVTSLQLSASGEHLDSLQVSGRHGAIRLSPSVCVLACGGVETTRLLLQAQRRQPTAFGGAQGPLGRYYMGHVSGKIADIVLNDPSTSTDHDFFLEGASYARRRLTFSAEAQRDLRLRNISFWTDNPPFHEPAHGSGLLSLVWLGLAFPPLGRRLVSEGVRLSHVGPGPRRLGPHLRNVAKQPIALARQLLSVFVQRFVRRPGKPGFLVASQEGRYALHYHAEHAPNPASRITLADDDERFGAPMAEIDLRFSEADARSVLTAHEELDARLREAGVARLQYRVPEDQRLARVMAQATDGFHQIGTTRMASQAKDGVVDPDCKVHGVDNLYIASSSIFPSSGQANPTLAAVALALRLASHLHRKYQPARPS